MLVSMQPHVPSKVKAYRMEHLTILLAFLMTIGTQVSAADPDDLQKLKDTGKCATCDLGGADLSGADLGGANLSGAYMQGAALCNTTMPDGSVIYSGC